MTAPRDEEVLRLQVAVDDSLLVGGGETPRDLKRVVHGLLRRNGAREELLAQRLTFQKLRDRIRDAPIRAEVEDREDIGMREGGDRFCLALEPRQRVRIGGDRRWKNLDRHVAIELPIPGAVDLAHPTRAERREDFVGAETRAGRECHSFSATAILSRR